MGRVGSQDLRTSFRAQYTQFYRDAIDVVLSQHKPEEAFHILERSRARSLVELLAERDLRFSSDLPAEMETERRSVAAEYDRVQQEIAGLNPQADGERIETLLERLRDLRRQDEKIAETIRRTSPRLASLRYPQPLDFQGVQRALDPGTLSLSFSVGPTQTYLFAAASGSPLTVAVLPIGREELTKQVETFVSLIRQFPPPSARGGYLNPELTELGARLYDELISPMTAPIEGAQRLLIVPDGPLNSLPWGALIRNGFGRDKKAEELQYLARGNRCISRTRSRSSRNWRRRGCKGGITESQPRWSPSETPSVPINPRRAC